MGPAEWIALVALALSVVVRDANMLAKLDAIGKRLDDIDRRAERHERLIEVEREARHKLELRLAQQEHDDD